MSRLFTKARQRVLSGLFTNLAAGWMGAIFIFPNFNDLLKTSNQLLLIVDIISAIVSLIIAFWFEERAKK